MDMKLELKLTLIDAEEGEVEIAADCVLSNVDQSNVNPGRLIELATLRLLKKLTTEGIAQAVVALEKQQPST